MRRDRVAIFRTEETVRGTVFHPANVVAKHLTRLAGACALTAERVLLLRDDLGYEILEPNGRPVTVTTNQRQE